MKKFFFPFLKKYNHLKQLTWHRFAIVVYWMVTAGSLVGIYFALYNPQDKALVNCFESEILLHPGNAQQYMNTVCSVFKTTPLVDFLIAVVGTVLISYLIQIVYYKVLLYIFFGKNLPTAE